MIFSSAPGGVTVCGAAAGKARREDAAGRGWGCQTRLFRTGLPFLNFASCEKHCAKSVGDDMSTVKSCLRFFSPSMTPALGSLQGGLRGSGQTLKMVSWWKSLREHTQHVSACV